MIDKSVYEIANKEYMNDLYINKKLGLPAIQKVFENEHNIKVSIGFIANRLQDAGIPRRSASLARRTVSNSPDWETSFLDETMIEAIDGFLIGDGTGYVSHDKQIARIGMGVQHKEFCDYCRSFFLPYQPTESHFYEDKSGKSSGTWNFRTRFHPDLYKIANRWYPADKPKKVVPKDVRITPLSVMLWFLGDGTCINNTEDNTVTVRLSTDAFPKEDIEDILIPKLNEKEIFSVRTSENRIRVITKGIPGFFKFIGRISPIKCYDYKFDLPEWRFEAIRMSDAAKQLNVSYDRLSHLVKHGIQPCYRATEKGRPRFLPEHLEKAKELIDSGELY